MDIVKQLRKFHAEIIASDGGESGQMAMTRQAADEIERLRAALREAVEILDGDGEYPATARRLREALSEGK